MLTGGKKLRELRQSCRETIEHISADAGITYKALSEIERDLTKQPSRNTIYRIVEALDKCARVSAEDWWIVFEAYGYKKPYPLPTEEEIEWARKRWRETYGYVNYPAYLIDFSQRLLDWNKYAPRLLNMRYDDVRLEHFQNVTIFDITFGLVNGLITIENQEEYLPSLVRVIKSEFQPYKDESWYDDCIQTAHKKYPLLKELWESIPDDSLQSQGVGNAVPIILNVGEALLRFQLVKIDYVTDMRFRVIQWIPVDEVTMAKCISWVQEESGNLRITSHSKPFGL